MGEFLRDVIASPLLLYGVAAGLLASVACGVVGTYVVTRRIAVIAGSISHCVLGGLGAAWYLKAGLGWEFAHPMAGAVVAAILAAVIIGWVGQRAKERVDTVISAIWAVGMAVGLLFIAKTPGYDQDLMTYLFGDILLVSRGDLWLIAALDAVILGVCFLFFRQLQAVCFDEEFARTRGVPVAVFDYLLLILIALTVVLLISVVGLVLVIALLTLPVAIAGPFARRMGWLMAASAVLCAVFTLGGMALAYGPNLPTGATIIVLAAGAYLAVLLARTAWGAVRGR